MVEQVTQHYQWTKPEVTKSASTWGGFLNTDLDSIDALVFANQQGIVPIGSITMFGGATAPANWLICDGRSLATTGTYAALFAVLQYAYGGSGANFNLPNLKQKFPLGAGTNALGSAGGSLSVPIAIGNLPAHAHPIIDVAHNHTINQSPHSHPDTGHGHPDAGSYQDAHHHTVPNNTVVGSGSGLTNGGASFSLQGNTQTSDAQPALHIGIGTGYAQNQAINANVSLVASGTNLSTTQNVGSNTPLSVMPPFVALNFLIRYQ